MSDLTPEAILKMDYNQLIGLVRETNRPPGGERSIRRIAHNGFLRADSRVLEIGTSTGVTAVEMARLVGCRITAIDINEPSLVEARERARGFGVGELISFERQDATRTPYDDGSFDMVFCGNVTSLVSDRERALTEYGRVLREGGFLAAIPMYYRQTPPEELVRAVSDAIQVQIKPQYQEEWLRFFHREPFALYWSEHYAFDRVEDGVVESFCAQILARPHLRQLSSAALETLTGRYREFMLLFRDNLSLMGYTLMLLRKESVQVDPELFTSRRVD